MRRILKALFLAWIGKKLINRAQSGDEPEAAARKPKRGPRKSAARRV